MKHLVQQFGRNHLAALGLLLGVFLIITISLAACWYDRAAADTLFFAAPADSVVYVSYRTLVLQPDRQLPPLPVNNFIAGYDHFLSLAHRVSYAFFPVDGRLESVVLFELKDTSTLVEPASSTSRFITETVFAVATSEAALSKVQATAASAELSLGALINRQFARAAGYGYVATRQLMGYVSDAVVPFIAQLPATVQFDLGTHQDAWVARSSVVTKVGTASVVPIITTIPETALAYISGEAFSALAEVLAGAGLGQTVAHLYQELPLVDGYAPFFNRPFELVMGSTGDMVLILHNITPAEFTDFEQIILGIFALLFPQEVVRTLPDGSNVAELVVDPSKVEKTTEFLIGTTFFVLTEPKNNQLLYSLNGQNLILATNRELLEQVLPPPSDFRAGIDISLLSKKCGFLSMSPLFTMNASLRESLRALFADQMIAIGLDHKGKIQACVSSF